MIGLAAVIGLGGACSKASDSARKGDQAQPPQTRTAPPPQPAPNDQARSQQQQQTTTGRVASVGTLEIVVEQPGQPQMHIRVESNVPVTVDGERASLVDVPVGSDANVVIEQRGDQMTAKRIDAMTRQPVRGTENPPR